MNTPGDHWREPTVWTENPYAGGGQKPPYARPSSFAAPIQPGPQGLPGQAAPFRSAEPRRDPLVYALASFFIPGLGTMINGQARRGLTIMAVYYGTPIVAAGILLFTLFTTGVDLMPVNLVVIFGGIAVMFGTWIWGIIDAYRGAAEHNRLHATG